jgi:hypothetical protein
MVATGKKEKEKFYCKKHPGFSATLLRPVFEAAVERPVRIQPNPEDGSKEAFTQLENQIFGTHILLLLLREGRARRGQGHPGCLLSLSSKHKQIQKYQLNTHCNIPR